MEPVQAESVDLVMGEIDDLENVVDRKALKSVCQSFFALFHVPIRVTGRSGTLLADAHVGRQYCNYLNQFDAGHSACKATIRQVKERDAASGPTCVSCFSGAAYMVIPIEYQGRQIGRFVVGPYWPAEEKEIPSELTLLDEKIDLDVAGDHRHEMPSAKKDAIDRVIEHLQDVIRVLLFSGHRAQLASAMQVESVRQNYRELAKKTAHLEESYEKMRELDRLKTNFLATISHELRTPLTSIMGYAEMLASESAGELNGEQTEFLDTIRRKADQLLNLISSLLDLGRLDAEQLEISDEPIDPKLLIEDVSSTIKPAANKKDLKVEVHADDRLPTLFGDPTRLRQVLLNLADNAVKFTPEGGALKLSAEASQWQPNSEDQGADALFGSARPAVAFSIQDSGIGIPPEALTRIFDAFYQVDSGTTRRHGGAGLGLSIAQRLINAHGGTIHVESAAGQGTTFTVVLPAGNA